MELGHLTALCRSRILLGHLPYTPRQAVGVTSSSTYAAATGMRQRAGLTQRQLADALGREQNYIGRIETSQRRVDLVELIQICRACGLDPATEIASLTTRIASRVPHKRPRSR